MLVSFFDLRKNRYVFLEGEIHIVISASLSHRSIFSACDRRYSHTEVGAFIVSYSVPVIGDIATLKWEHSLFHILSSYRTTDPMRRHFSYSHSLRLPGTWSYQRDHQDEKGQLDDLLALSITTWHCGMIGNAHLHVVDFQQRLRLNVTFWTYNNIIIYIFLSRSETVWEMLFMKQFVNIRFSSLQVN